LSLRDTTYEISRSCSFRTKRKVEVGKWETKQHIIFCWEIKQIDHELDNNDLVKITGYRGLSGIWNDLGEMIRYGGGWDK